jgi:hypothetical protein
MLIMMPDDAELEQQQGQEILKLLLSTIPRYTDQNSRLAVLRVLSSLLSHSPNSDKLFQGLTKYLESTIAQACAPSAIVAANTKYALLGWVTIVYGTSSQVDELLVKAWAAVVDSLLSENAGPTKIQLKKSTLVHTRRAIRSVRPYTCSIAFSSGELIILCPQKPKAIPKLVEVLTTAKVDPAYQNSALLGIVADVTIRLRDTKGEKEVAKTTLEAIKVSVRI